MSPDDIADCYRKGLLTPCDTFVPCAIQDCDSDAEHAGIIRAASGEVLFVPQCMHHIDRAVAGDEMFFEVVHLGIIGGGRKS